MKPENYQTTPANSPAERIARLRQIFIEQLPERISQARAWQSELKHQPGSERLTTELHRILHNIKGTGQSFGFKDLGLAAARGETLFAPSADGRYQLAADWDERLSKCLAQLEREAGKFVNLSAPGNAIQLLPRKPNEPEITGNGRLIYICDDETLVLEQLATQISCFGYETVCFTDTRRFYQAVLERRPDAVIMDVNFPQGHNAGIQVLMDLHSETGQALPAVFLSARNDFDARLGAVLAGGEAYFAKPARPTEIVAALDDLTQVQHGETFKILIVDDEPEMAEYHAIILQEAGMHTMVVHEPRQVLQALGEFRPDLVLMDMYMPGCSGRDLSKMIRQVPDYLSLPIVYLSSETDRRKQFSAMRVGAEGFLAKPVVPDELVCAVMIRAERMRTLRSLMARDSLTGLFNHSTTTQLLEGALKQAARREAPLSFVMIDIDQFKLVNDTYGHQAGDRVLVALARILQQRLRNYDMLGRYGGEEFAVVLQDVADKQAERMINAIREDFARIVFHSPRGEFGCTFSAGIAVFPRQSSLEVLREAADQALYRAKHSGRNAVVVD